MSTQRIKETYRESYHKGTRMVSQGLLPDRFPFTAKGWKAR